MESERRQRIIDLNREIGLVEVKRAWYQAYLCANGLKEGERERKQRRLDTLTTRQDDLEYELLSLTHPWRN